MTEMTATHPDDILERVLQREVELARANEALRHEHFQRRRVEKTREIFSELSTKLMNAAAPHPAAVAILEAADQLFGWDAAFVDVYSEEDKRFHAVVRYDVKEGTRTEIAPSSSSVPFTPLREQLFRDGPLLILRGEEPDAAEEWLLAFGSAEKKSASLMFAPMSREGRIVGVLSIQSYQQDAYTRKDLDLLQVLGNYCCHGLERGFAEGHLKRARQKLQLLGKMVPALVWTTNEDARILTAQGSGWNETGSDSDRAIGQLITDVFPNSTELLEAHRAACTGAAVDCEFALAGKQHKCRVEPMTDEAGRVACCLAVAVPLTEP